MLEKRILSIMLAITMLLGVCMFDAKTVEAATGSEEIICLNVGKSYNVPASSGEVVFKVVPEKTGIYRFYSIASEENDINAFLEGENFGTSASCTDYGFTISYSLQEGETYYLSCEDRNNKAFQVHMEKVILDTLTTDKPYSAQEEYDLWLCLTVPESGYYKIATSNSDVEALNGDVYTDDMYLNIGWDTGKNLSMSAFLEEGISYYVHVCSDESAFSCDVYLEKMKEVTGIEVVSCNNKPLIEYFDGWWDEHSDGSEYYYYYYELREFDIILRIFYEDGTSVDVPYDSWIGGIRVENYDNQEMEPWTVGGQNYVIIEYCGVEVNYPIEILKNPVKRISLKKAPNCTGTLTYTSWDGYTVSLSELTDMELLVEYNDDTSIVITEHDMDEWGCFNGYYIDVELPVVEEAGIYTATLSYMGCETTFEVQVLQFPYTEIEVVKGPDYATVFFPDFIGMKLKLKNVDGTEETLTITEDNIYYRRGQGYWGYVELNDGLNLYISQEWDYDEGGLFYWINIQGVVSCSYYEIECLEQKPIRTITASSVSLRADGMKFDVTYEDGTTQKINVIKAYADYFEKDAFSGMIRTELGVSDCNIVAKDIDFDGVIDEYTIDVFDQTIVVDAKGDVQEECTHENAKHTSAKAATCTEVGNVEYWHCPDCEGLWLDETRTQLTSLNGVTLKTLEHRAVSVKTVVPTAEKTGLTAGTKCSECGEILSGCEVIPKVAKLGVTKITKTTSGKKKVTIKFKKVSGIDGYEIQLATKKNMKKGLKKVTVKARKVKCVVKKLHSKTNYWIRIRTYKVVKGEKVCSAWSGKKKVKTK